MLSGVAISWWISRWFISNNLVEISSNVMAHYLWWCIFQEFVTQRGRDLLLDANHVFLMVLWLSWNLQLTLVFMSLISDSLVEISSNEWLIHYVMCDDSKISVTARPWSIFGCLPRFPYGVVAVLKSDADLFEFRNHYDYFPSIRFSVVR